MKPFGLLIARSAAWQMIQLPPDEHQGALHAMEILADHPFTAGLPSWTGEDGRTNYLRQVHDWTLTFAVDHAVRQVHVLEIKRY